MLYPQRFSNSPTACPSDESPIPVVARLNARRRKLVRPLPESSLYTDDSYRNRTMKTSILYLFLFVGSLMGSTVLYAQPYTIRQLNEKTVGVGTDQPKAFLNVTTKRTVLFGTDSTGGVGRQFVKPFDKWGSLQGGFVDFNYTTARTIRFTNHTYEPKMVWYGSKGAFRAGGVYTGADRQSSPSSSSGEPRAPYTNGETAFGRGYGGSAEIENRFRILNQLDTLSSFRFWDDDVYIATPRRAVRDIIGDFSFASGANTRASGQFSTAMGYQTQAIGHFSTAMGYKSWAVGDLSFVVGNQSIVGLIPDIGTANRLGSDDTPITDGNLAICIGSNSGTFSNGGIVLGNYSVSGSDYSTAIGFGSATGTDLESVSIGDPVFRTFKPRSDGTKSKFSTAIGYKARAQAEYALALGQESQANGSHSTALGYLNTASGIESMALGMNSTASGDHSITLGNYAQATGSYAVAIGRETTAGGQNATTMGFRTQATGLSSFATGELTVAGGDYATALGFKTQATGVKSLAGGGETEAAADYSTALGFQSKATGTHSIATGQATAAIGTAAVSMGTATGAQGNYSFALGQNSRAVGAASIASGLSTQALGNRAVSMGTLTVASGDNSVAMGTGTRAGGTNSVSIGDQSQAAGTSAFALGQLATASGDRSVAIGTNVSTNGQGGSVIIGDGTGVPATNDQPHQIKMRFAGGYTFFTTPNTQNGPGVRLDPGSNAWAVTSDSTTKEKFQPADGAAFLKKIGKMRLGSWNYKGQDAKIFRHYGPMAQDFFAAFGRDGVGTIGGEKSINQADFDGVNLIAIKALIEEVNQLRADNQQLRQRLNGVDQLKAELETARAQGQVTRTRLDKIEALLNDRPVSTSSR